MKAMFKEGRNFWKTTIEFIGQFYKEFYDSIKGINKTGFLTKLLSVLMICVAYAFFCGLREGTGELYMSVFIPAFFANALIVLFCCVYNSSNLYTMLTVFLVTTGFALQIFMLPPEESESLAIIYRYIIFVFIGIAMSMLTVPFLALLSSRKLNENFLKKVIIIVTILMYILLLFLGKEVNGAKSWLYIGNIGFQITEVTKVLAGVYFTICLMDQKQQEKEQSIETVAVFLIHAAFLFMVNELGTLCISGIVYFVLKLLYARKRIYIVYEIVIMLVIFTILLGICYGIYKTSNSSDNSKQSAERTITIDDSELDDTKTFTQRMVERLQSIYPKLEKRTNVFLRRGELTERDTYQIDAANKALLNVEWFGSEGGSLSYVPEIRSDFVFIYLTVRLGFIGMVLVLITLIFMLAETYIAAAKTSRNFEAILAICYVSFIVFQSLVCICSNIGIFPVVGLPFAFLANGGSAMCVNIIMTFFIIYFMRKNEDVSIVSEEKRNV